MTILADFRAKYPQYDSVSDADLSDALHKKYYSSIPKQEFDVRVNQQRIDEATATANEPMDIRQGSILPFTKINGQAAFDSDQGLLGVLKRGFMLPGQVAGGEVSVPRPSEPGGSEMIGRVNELASMAPAGMAGRMIASRAALKPAQQMTRQNMMNAGEFGIDLSKGQATRRFADQAFEEDALTGGRGSLAQGIVSRQRDRQAEQVRAAQGGIRDRAAPSTVDDTYEAAGNVGTAIADRADQLKTSAQAAYKAADEFGGEVRPDAAKTLQSSLRGILDEVGAMEGTAIGSDLPVVKRIMSRVDDLATLKNAPEGDVTGIGWQNFERIRKQINAAKGSNPNEDRILGRVKAGLDNWLETTVDDGLVSGSPKFLKSLKDARGLWRQYSEIAKSPTQIVRKMAERSADSVEIANWLYGANKVGGRTQSAGVVREIKSLIGEKSPAFQDLKRNVMTRLFDDVRQGDSKTFGRLAGDINEFTTGKGRELAKALYDDTTIKELNRFAGVLRNLTPDALATNPPRSGQTVARRFWDSARIIAPLLGWTVGDMTGLVAGLTVSGAATTRSAVRARGAVSPRLPSQGSRSFAGPTNAGARGLAGPALGSGGSGLSTPLSITVGRKPTYY